MIKLNYNLKAFSKDPNAPKSIYLRYGESQASIGEKTYIKDWDKKAKRPKAGTKLFNQLDELYDAVKVQVRGKTDKQVTTPFLKRAIEIHNNGGEDINVKYPFSEVWKYFNDPKRNPKCASWDYTKTSGLGSKWNTWHRQTTEIMLPTMFDEDFILAFDEDILTWEACDKIMDWVLTYPKWGTNKTRNNWISHWRQICDFTMSLFPHSRIPMGLFPLQAEDNTLGSVQPTQEELDRLFQYDFTDKDHQLYRDIFKLGIFIGQHINDFLSYTQDHKTITDKGSYSIVNKRDKNIGKKTEVVTGMLVTKEAKQLYDKLIPYSKWTDSNSEDKIKHKLQQGFKTIFKEAGLDREVEAIKKQGRNPSIRGLFPLHEIVTFGMCRNIASTLYKPILSDKLYSQTMGHSTETAEKSYYDKQQGKTKMQSDIEEQLLKNPPKL